MKKLRTKETLAAKLYNGMARAARQSQSLLIYSNLSWN